ncbi:4-hydroxybenzoyl-CoA reductase subunit alpha [Caulifigura coniformis]|uniref:4-hydroxybenzoyl-CoA reductase subunit alpha n=1 Tax=Caulifigura coniformis TaxID=2527983 RepID=A0A517SF24_9PLAN|nr:xanthine dehydrogenase family protein molybdopterin-binding subunit [Caulifigura coniformis]QDT54731.1 4-hydroxybenzoyl-CoA reductase subunit alpha [Caulifigura coniformis]
MATSKSKKPAKSKSKYKVIGTRPIRHDGADKVTGRARYGADTKLSGQLAGYILRSPHAHARIRHVDISAAVVSPGVHAVLIGSDLPEQGDRIAELGEGAVNMRHLRSNVLAQDKVLYRGHAVAAVAADNIHLAEDAAKKIVIEYELLPLVLDARSAMKPDAPILNDDVRTVEFGEVVSDSPTNVAKKVLFETGDIAAGFASASVIVEREFSTATVHQGYIEPHASSAVWHRDGRVTVWTCTQGSFTVRQQLAELLHIPATNIKVIPTEIGGGFGGKISVYEQPLAVLLSKKSGRPVKMILSRTDTFEATGPTPGSFIRVKLGADSSGRLVAGEAWLAYEAGAFPGSPIGPGCMCIFSCYDVPNARVEGYDVCVNKPRTNAYRAPGSTNASFAVESVIEDLCDQLNIDPLAFRLKNAAREGTRRVDGIVYPRIGLVECLEAVGTSDHWDAPIGPKSELKPATPSANGHAAVPVYRPSNLKIGRGIATGYWFNAGLKSSATVNVNFDGKVTLLEGSTDIGGSRAALAMILAETLGIAAEDVNPFVVDTDGVGYTDVTGGSRVTHTTGAAVHMAGLKIRDQMRELAAQIWGCPASKVKFKAGQFNGPEDKSFTFKELAARGLHHGEPISASATVNMDTCGGAFGAHICDVAVDPDTGKVDILRYTVVQDCGTAIHPSYVEGQMQGGAAQGIGWALNEEYFYDAAGTMRNSSYLDYRIPTCLDLPEIETIIVEVPNPIHPYGVRGVGEVPICPPPAAIAAAIHQAVGARMHDLPMNPPRVLAAILAKES